MKPPHLLPLSPEGVFEIDNSSFEWLMKCQRGADYLVRQRRKKSLEADALIYGGNMHTGLAYRYARLPTLDPLSPQQKMQVLTVLSNAFSANPTSPEGWRTEGRALDVMQKYLKQNEVEDFQVYHHNSQPFVEKSFAVPFGEIYVGREVFFRDAGGEIVSRHMNYIPVVWTGKIDCVIEWQNGIWVFDHKTSSVGGQYFFTEYQLSTQMLGYILATQTLIAQPISGVLINAIVSRPPAASGNTTNEFMRSPVPFTHEMGEEMKQDVNAHITNFFISCFTDYFPKSPTQCVTKYGRCNYHDVCTIPDTITRNFMLYQTGEYEDNTWSPHDADEIPPHPTILKPFLPPVPTPTKKKILGAMAEFGDIL